MALLYYQGCNQDAAPLSGNCINGIKKGRKKIIYIGLYNINVNAVILYVSKILKFLSNHWQVYLQYASNISTQFLSFMYFVYFTPILQLHCHICLIHTLQFQSSSRPSLSYSYLLVLLYPYSSLLVFVYPALLPLLVNERQKPLIFKSLTKRISRF